jgi:endoglycosylceramidase
MDLPSPIPERPGAGRSLAARGLVSALFLLVSGACPMASLPSGESVAAARSGAPAPARDAASSAVLRVEGRHFVGPDGRVVLLRGVTLGGACKLPPFPTPDDPVLFDRLVELGFNAIRLPFIWEAYEPEPGRYDEAYLGRLVAVAATACTRGLFVIVDIHQDGFARTLCYGCGAGFPLWAVSPRATPHPPDNGRGCKGWALLELTDPGVHRSFADFYADAYGVRTRYLAMLGRVAKAFAAVPGVVGYEPLNEPWGDERREIAPLYRDAAAALRANHPTAILFLQGRGPSATGFRTRLPRLCLDNIVFAPHYYKPLAIVREDWGGRTAGIDRAFGRMAEKAAEWGVPLLVGEFGFPAGARRGGDYVDYLYDRLDAALASGMQWNVSPHQPQQAGDGWNGEDYNLLDETGQPRPTYRPRPYPHRVAGIPICFRFEPTAPPRGGPRLRFVWAHCPGLGPTEIVVPAGLFPPGSQPRAEPGDATCQIDQSRRLLTCEAPRPTTIRLVLEAP